MMLVVCPGVRVVSGLGGVAKRRLRECTETSEMLLSPAKQVAAEILPVRCKSSRAPNTAKLAAFP